MTRSTRGLFVALLGSLALGGCVYKPWDAHSATADKPTSPLTAPATKATLVVIVSNPQRSGNGSYTVFEGEEPLAQIDESLAAWTTATVAPGVHHFYVRTWASAFCMRMDATMAPGKVYVINLNGQNTDHPGILGSNGNVIPQAAFLVPGQHTPAGALFFLPHVKLDVDAARAELKEHRSQREQCVEAANAHTASAATPTVDLGFEQIDFTTTK